MGLGCVDEDSICIDGFCAYWRRPDLFLYRRGVPILANDKRCRSQSDSGNSRTVQEDPYNIEAVHDALHYSNCPKKVNDLYAQPRTRPHRAQVRPRMDHHFSLDCVLAIGASAAPMTAGLSNSSLLSRRDVSSIRRCWYSSGRASQWGPI
jgi:hypothetical protein